MCGAIQYTGYCIVRSMWHIHTCAVFASCFMDVWFVSLIMHVWFVLTMQLLFLSRCLFLQFAAVNGRTRSVKSGVYAQLRENPI